MKSCPVLTSAEGMLMAKRSLAEFAIRSPKLNRKVGTMAAASSGLFTGRGITRGFDDCTSIICAREVRAWLRRTLKELFMTVPELTIAQTEANPGVSTFRKPIH